MCRGPCRATRLARRKCATSTPRAHLTDTVLVYPFRPVEIQSRAEESKDLAPWGGCCFLQGGGVARAARQALRIMRSLKLLKQPQVHVWLFVSVDVVLHTLHSDAVLMRFMRRCATRVPTTPKPTSPPPPSSFARIRSLSSLSCFLTYTKPHQNRQTRSLFSHTL